MVEEEEDEEVVGVSLGELVGADESWYVSIGVVNDDLSMVLCRTARMAPSMPASRPAQSSVVLHAALAWSLVWEMINRAHRRR